MKRKKGSCLNEEYTEQIKEIYKLVKEANEKFESLPGCIGNTNTGMECDDVRGDLADAKASVWCLAYYFGISIDE
jgi:hypothetical protein